MLFFCSYGWIIGVRTVGVVRRGGGPAPLLVRVCYSWTSAQQYTFPDYPHVDADTPSVDSEVRNSFLLFSFCFITIGIALSKLILFFQATRCRTSPFCMVGRGG
jgi:hypothetical protein